MACDERVAVLVIDGQLVGVKVFGNEYFGAFPFVSTRREIVGVAVVEDGIVAPYRIGAQISFGLFHRQRIGRKVLALLLEDTSGNEPCHRMRLGVCRAAQPADGLLIEQLYVLIT